MSRRFLLFLAVFPWLLLLIWPTSRAVLRDYFPFNISQKLSIFWNGEDEPSAPRTPQGALSEVWARLDYEGESARNFQAAAQDFPNDKTLLALRLRYDQVLRFNETWENQTRQDGPLLAGWPDWSVRLRNPNYAWANVAVPSSPLGAPPAPPIHFSPPKPDETGWLNFLAAAQRGQKLEPDNAFWDWMTLQALCELKRDAQFRAVLLGCASKKRYHDFFEEQNRSHAQWRRENGFLGARERWNFWNSQQHNYLTSDDNAPATRLAAQMVMGLRLQNQPQRALKLGLASLHLARLRRLQAATPNLSRMAKEDEQMALTFARIDAGIDTGILNGNFRSSPFSRPAVGDLVGYAPSLAELAKQQKQPVLARRLLAEWDECANWRLGSASALLNQKTLSGIAWWPRLALFVGVSLLFFGGLFAVFGRKNDVFSLAEIGRGLVWALVGWILALLGLLSLMQSNGLASLFWDFWEERQLHNLIPQMAIFPSALVFLGAALTARFRQWKRNRAAHSEKPLLQMMSWGLEPMRDWRPLVWLFVRASVIFAALSACLLSWTAPLWLDALKTALDADLFDSIERQINPIFGLILTAWILFFSLIFVFGALCLKPEAKLARREMRVLIVNFAAGAFIGGSWLALLFFVLWNGAETQFAREFAPFERGQIVKILATKAGLPTR